MEKPKKRSVPMETAMPEIESGFAEVETRADAPESPAADPTPYEGSRTRCPKCGSVLLDDRLTQACVVSSTRDLAEDERGQYVDRYMLCRHCNPQHRFLARERLTAR